MKNQTGVRFGYRHVIRRARDLFDSGCVPQRRVVHRIGIERLESRMMLHSSTDEPHDHPPEHSLRDHVHATVSISVEGEPVTIPALIGFGDLGLQSFIHTHREDGELHLEPIGVRLPPSPQTLGDFFDTWRTNAGIPGNNPDAILTPTQLLNNVADDNDVLRMFVNGVETRQFGDYVMHDGDEIELTFESIADKGTVRGEIFDDKNFNQIRDANEDPLEGIVVFVDGNDNERRDAEETFTSTDASGSYSLQLSPGRHIIRAQVPDRFVQTSPRNPDAHTITVDIGREVADVDFAIAQLGAGDDLFEVDEDSQNVVLDVLANDTTAGGNVDDLTITQVGLTDQGGTVEIAPGASSLIYTPAPDFCGTETFTYSVFGGTVTEQATVVVEVRTVNDPPTATDDVESINEDVTTELRLVANDLQAPDTDETLRIVSVGPTSNGGVVTISPDRTSVTYQPPGNFFGTDTFTYTISDRETGGLTDEATVTVTIVEVNDDPIASPDSFNVEEDSTGNALDVLANDNFAPDVDETLTISFVDASSFSAGGTADISADSTSLTYTPAADFFGTETFIYGITDGRGGTAEGTVQIAVSPSNDPPTAIADRFTFTKDTGPHLLEVLVNDSDFPDAGEMLTILEFTSASRGGSVRISDDRQNLEYTPLPGFVGDESFTYTIGDGTGETAEATIDITVRDFVPSNLSGFVYFDRNDNGVKDPTELPIGNVIVTLSGTDSLGESVNLVAMTIADGSYAFNGLVPGTYTITHTQPQFVLEGQETVGSQGGQASNDRFLIELDQGVDGVNNNFGELGRNAEMVSLQDYFAIKPDVSIISAASPGGPSWYSIDHGWDGYRSTDVSLSMDRGQVELAVVHVNGTERSINVPVADGQNVQIMRQVDDTYLIGIIAHSSDFGLAADGSNAADGRATVDANRAEGEGQLSPTQASVETGLPGVFDNDAAPFVPVPAILAGTASTPPLASQFDRDLPLDLLNLDRENHVSVTDLAFESLGDPTYGDLVN